MTPTRHRRASAIIAVAATLLATAGTAALALPASADGSGHSVTVTPDSGADLTLTTPALTTDLTCPSGYKFATWISSTLYAAPISSDTGHYLGDAAFPDSGLLAVSITTVTPDDSGSMPATAGIFPTGATGTWRYAPVSGHAITENFIASSDLAPGTYSLAVGCGHGTANISIETDGTSLEMAWATFTVAAGGAWTFESVSPSGPSDTSTSLSVDVNGTTASATADVTPGDASGTIQFLDGGTVVATEPFSGSAVDDSVSVAAAGVHSLTAKFVPTVSDDFNTSTSSGFTVNTTTTTLATPTLSDGKVQLAATVKVGGTDADGGTVQFKDGTANLGTPQAVSGGQASYAGTTALSVGDHGFTASYVPPAATSTTAFTGSASAAQPLTVSPSDSDATNVGLTATGGLGDDGKATAVLTAQILSGDTTETDADGQLQFLRDGTAVGSPIDVADGTATFTDTALDFGTTYTYTAQFTPAAGSDLDAATSDDATVNVAAPVELADGSTATEGTAYFVDFGDGSFADSETVTGEVHSVPVSVGSATSTGTGSVHFAFIMPAGLGAGNHSLVLTGAGGLTQTVSFSIAAGTNDPAAFSTDWINRVAATNPAGVAGLFTLLLLLTAAAIVGARFWLLRRRSAPAAVVATDSED